VNGSLARIQRAAPIQSFNEFKTLLALLTTQTLPADVHKKIHK
jgi:hypothetical protein